MAVNKIYQDSIIAGGSIRDGQGKRIDTTYAKKSDIPDTYTKTEVNNLLVDKADIEDIPAPYILPTASVDTLGGVKIDGETINIDSNGKIFSKAMLLEENKDLNTLITPDITYYGTTTGGYTNLPIEGKSFNLQVLNAFNNSTDPAIVQQFTSEDGNIYVRAYYYNSNPDIGGSTGGGGGIEFPMGPEWTAWSKLATTNDIPSDTEKLTMSYADETLTFLYPDTSYGVVTFDLTPTNGTLEVTTPAIKKDTNKYKVVKNKDITYNYTAQGYKAKSDTVNVTEDTTITVVLEAGAGAGAGGDTGVEHITND